MKIITIIKLTITNKFNSLRVLITGASGFVGKKACYYLAKFGHKVTANSRNNCDFPLDIKFIRGENIFNTHPKSGVLKGHDCIVHLAGRTSSKDSKNKNSYSEYRVGYR